MKVFQSAEGHDLIRMVRSGGEEAKRYRRHTHFTVLTSVNFPIQSHGRSKLRLLYKEQSHHSYEVFDLIIQEQCFKCLANRFNATAHFADQTPRTKTQLCTCNATSKYFTPLDWYLQKRPVMKTYNSKHLPYSSRSLAPKYALADPTREW